MRLFSGSPSLEKKSIEIPEDTYQWEILDLDEAVWWEFEETKGKVVFLNFWATWCGPCVAEMTSIQELYNKYGHEVKFILISTEAPKKIKEFKDRKGYSIPFSSIVNAPEIFQTRTFPTTFIINKKGQIVVKEFGAHDWNGKNVRNLLDELLEE
jgi:thiol-disulfide isomerase/thioredoxin